MKRGLPAVVVCTEQFRQLAQAVMRGQNVPESIAIHIGANPEYIPPSDLDTVADRIAAEAIERLTRSHHA